MIAYHVTTFKKLSRYVQSGCIKGLVRVWTTIQEAERFSKQTGRKVIIRLKINKKDFKKLEGHKGLALISDKDCKINSL